MASRGSFSSKIGFIAAAAGSAVGLGNIWRFPYEAGENGGAAFLLIYLICIFLIGFPVMVGEISIGRSTQLNAFGAYKQLGGKKWGYLGYWGILSAIMFLSVYNVVAGWAFAYFIQMVDGKIMHITDFGTHFSEQISDVSDLFFYSLGFMFLTAFIVARGIKKGVESASKILMPALFIMLLALIAYSFTLDNALEGIEYYLIPDLSKINLETVYNALGQAFFSLSLGMAALITYGSYMGKQENIVNSAAWVTSADTAVAFLAGLLIFPLVFSQGISPSEGPGLVFVVLPGIFASLGAIGPWVGAVFFLLLCFAALTSTISLLEIPVTYLVDEKGYSRIKVVIVTSIIIFIVGIPSMLSQGAVDFFTNFTFYEGKVKTIFDVVFDIFSDVGLPLGGFLMSIFIVKRWKINNFHEELAKGNPSYKGSFMEKYLKFSISYFAPIFLGAIFVLTVLQKFFGIKLI
ncbi:MAG: sodium-dependent transporter [Cyclobacteriaceae bacterium]|nr:sodium-dependent transporter [Cyclobacteriaceae bacterium]